MAFSQNQIDEIRRRLLACYGARDTDFKKVTSLRDDDIIAIVQDGENRAISAAGLAEYIGSKVGIPIGIEARIAGVKTVESGGEATATVKVVNGNRLDFTFGIPRGDKGECTCDGGGSGDTDTPVASAAISGDASSLEPGDTAQLTLKVNPSDASGYTVKWSSSDTSVATVDQDGKVTAVGEGTCTITVTITNSDGSTVTASYTVTVAAAASGKLTPTFRLTIPASLTLPYYSDSYQEDNSCSIIGGSSKQFGIMTDSDGKLSLENSDTSIAYATWYGSSVDAATTKEGDVYKGWLFVNATGIATITFRTAETDTYYAGSVTVTVKVIDAAEYDAADRRSWTLKSTELDPAGGTLTFTVNDPDSWGYQIYKMRSWLGPDLDDFDSACLQDRQYHSFHGTRTFTLNYSANTGEYRSAVVTCNKFGVESCTGDGGVIKNGTGIGSAILSQEAQESTGSITLDQTQMELASDETKQLAATVSDSISDKTVTWSSSDDAYVTVDESGNVTKVKTGKAVTITATASDGSTATCKVYDYYSVSMIDAESTGNYAIKVGSSLQMALIGINLDLIEKYVWASSDESVLTVSQSGLVTAVAEGEADITCECSGSSILTKTAYKYGVTGYNDGSGSDTGATSVTVSGASSVEEGGTTQLTATVSPSDASGYTLSWASLSEGVATVDQNGKVTGVSAGNARITVTLTNSDGSTMSAYKVITVTAAGQEVTLESITVSPSSASIAAGEVKELTVTANYSDGSTADVTSEATWSTSNPSYATVDGGTITGVAAGSATVTASYGGKEDFCSVTVTEPSSAETHTVTVNATPSGAKVEMSTDGTSYTETDSLTVDAGTTVYYRVSAVPYKTVSGSTVADEDKTIDVTLEMLACFTVIVETESGDNITSSSTIKLGTSESSLAEYGSGIIYVEDDTDVYWEVSKSGYVTQSGCTNVGTGHTETVVLEKRTEDNTIDSFSISPASVEVAVGETSDKLTYSISPASVYHNTVTWESGDEQIFTVASPVTAKVTGVNAGHATLTASVSSMDAAVDGNITGTYTATCDVTVYSAEVTCDDVFVGDSAQAVCTVSPSDAEHASVTPSWSSSDASVATVDQDGKVTGLSVGTAVITATVGAASASCTVEVLRMVNVTVTSVPSDATVTLEAQGYSAGGTGTGEVTITVPSGTVVTYCVEASGYKTESDTISTTDGEDVEKTVTLTATSTDGLRLNASFSCPAYSVIAGQMATISVENATVGNGTSYTVTVPSSEGDLVKLTISADDIQASEGDELIITATVTSTDGQTFSDGTQANYTNGGIVSKNFDMCNSASVTVTNGYTADISYQIDGERDCSGSLAAGESVTETVEFSGATAVVSVTATSSDGSTFNNDGGSLKLSPGGSYAIAFNDPD